MGSVITGPANVQPLVLCQLAGFAAADVIVIDIQVVVTVGYKIDILAHPHRVAIGAHMVGDVL